MVSPESALKLGFKALKTPAEHYIEVYCVLLHHVLRRLGGADTHLKKISTRVQVLSERRTIVFRSIFPDFALLGQNAVPFWGQPLDF